MGVDSEGVVGVVSADLVASSSLSLRFSLRSRCSLCRRCFSTRSRFRWSFLSLSRLSFSLFLALSCCSTAGSVCASISLRVSFSFMALQKGVTFTSANCSIDCTNSRILLSMSPLHSVRFCRGAHALMRK